MKLHMKGSFMAELDNNLDVSEEEAFTINIEFEDGENVLCEPYLLFEFEDKEYVAMIPVNEESEDVYLFEYHDLNDEEFEFFDIEDEATYDRVVDEFNRIMEETEEIED